MTTKPCPGGRRYRAVVGSLIVATSVVVSEPAWAQVGGTPNAAGMPGAALVSQLINWLMWVSLMASLGAVLYGAAMWRGGARLGNAGRAEDGRHYVAGGAIGALIAGLAVIMINTLFKIGQAGG